MEGEGVSIRERNRVNKVTPSQVNSLADGTPHTRLWAQMELLSSPSHREEPACLPALSGVGGSHPLGAPGQATLSLFTELRNLALLGVFHLEA